MGYAATAVRGLEACPFCKEMFPSGETEECPLCGVKVVAANKLPEPSTDDDGVPIDPDETVLPWTYFGLARGPLIVLCALGLAAFCMPWVHTFAPDKHVFTGIDIARRTGVTWSAGVAWFTLLPLILSRRSIRQMRGARLAIAVLAMIPALAAASLLLHPPTGAQAHGVTFSLLYKWDPAIFATVALGLIATALGAARFGGDATDIQVKTGSSANHTLH
jgi:hypothetical protein